MANKQILGITYVVPEGADPQGVYEQDGGVLTFEINEPYLLDDDESLMDPMPVFDAGAPTFLSKDGKLMASIPIIRGFRPTGGPVDPFEMYVADGYVADDYVQ